MSKSKKTTSPKQSKAKSTKTGRDSAAAVLGDTINAPLAKAAKLKAAKAPEAPEPTTGGGLPPAAELAAIGKTLVNDPNLGLVTKEPKPARKPKEPKADGKLSCLDAAAKVLCEKKEPMTTKEMIETMAAKGLWSSPNGQTPAATLYSAILREIKTKGKDSRFQKTEKGKFGIRG